MRGWALVNPMEDKDRYAASMKAFERAIALDPQNVEAMTGLATVVQFRAFDGYSDDSMRDFGRAAGLIKRALVLRPENS
jgi:cytochrome c-type biogenesis protein CcmH/NrfG